MGGTMLSKNFSELENRVRAIMNTSDADFHTRTASLMYGVKFQDVTREQRKNAKTFNYGRLYNMSTRDLLKLLDLVGK